MKEYEYKKSIYTLCKAYYLITAAVAVCAYIYAYLYLYSLCFLRSLISLAGDNLSNCQ